MVLLVFEVRMSVNEHPYGPCWKRNPKALHVRAADCEPTIQRCPQFVHGALRLLAASCT
jgi:hypothetical protein